MMRTITLDEFRNLANTPKKYSLPYDWEHSDDTVYYFDDGTSYNGQCFNYEFNGYGVRCNPNITVHVGCWKNGKLHGKCSYIHTDGYKYDGIWKNGIFDKFIKEHSPDEIIHKLNKHNPNLFYGSCTDVCIKYSDDRQSHDVYRYNNEGAVSKYDLKQYIKTGFTVHYKLGSVGDLNMVRMIFHNDNKRRVYVGEMNNKYEPSGFGIMYIMLNDELTVQHEGMWNNNTRHGWGTSTYQVGVKIKCKWYNDKINGYYKRTEVNGDTYYGYAMHNFMVPYCTFVPSQHDPNPNLNPSQRETVTGITVNNTNPAFNAVKTLHII